MTNFVQFTLLRIQVTQRKQTSCNCHKCHFYKLSYQLCKSKLPINSIYPQRKQQYQRVKISFGKIKVKGHVFYNFETEAKNFEVNSSLKSVLKWVLLVCFHSNFISPRAIKVAVNFFGLIQGFFGVTASIKMSSKVIFCSHHDCLLGRIFEVGDTV